MIGLGMKLGLAALVTYWISSAFGWNFWTVAIILGVLVVGHHLSRHFGWLGMTPATRTAGGGISGGMMRFVVGFSTLTFVMMVGTKLIGVSNNYAFSYFLGLGPRPWLYPAGVTTDLLIWVALFFLSMVIGALAAYQRLKPALMIFGLTLVFLFTAREMPRTAEVVRPKPMNGPATPLLGESQAWADTDQKVAERGVIPTAALTTYRYLFGGTLGEVAGRTGGAIRSVLPSRSTAPRPASTAASVSPAPPPEYPTKGEGHATMSAPLKAFITPGQTSVTPSRAAKYCFAEDLSVCYEDRSGHKMEKDPERIREWKEMPPGKYLVSPLEADDIFFQWQ